MAAMKIIMIFMGKKTRPILITERDETIRKGMLSLLEDKGPLSAKELSGFVKISEKEVYAHLEHIKKSLHRRKDAVFAVTPSVCNGCGFEFKKRERLKRPSRCPVCKSESLEEPVFCVRPAK